MLGCQRELKSPLLCRLKSHSLKAFHLLHRPSYACDNVSYVELYDFIARALADVFDVNAYHNAAGRLDALRAECQIRQPELRIAQTESERKKRRNRSVQILRTVLVVWIGRP